MPCHTHSRLADCAFTGRCRTCWLAVQGFNSSHPPCQGLPWRNIIPKRLLALRPACSLTTLRRPLASKCFSPCRYLQELLRLLPARATVAGRDLNPPGDGALSRRTWEFRLRLRHTVSFKVRGASGCGPLPSADMRVSRHSLMGFWLVPPRNQERTGLEVSRRPRDPGTLNETKSTGLTLDKEAK